MVSKQSEHWQTSLLKVLMELDSVGSHPVSNGMLCILLCTNWEEREDGS